MAFNPLKKSIFGHEMTMVIACRDIVDTRGKFAKSNISLKPTNDLKARQRVPEVRVNYEILIVYFIGLWQLYFCTYLSS